MTTISDLLKIPRFSNIQVLNQQANLDRTVDTIEISETPDMAHYLPKNVFLLTTAMSFTDDPVGLCEMIRSLAALPAAGIGIKLGRFLNELDPMILEVADELNFPILQLPATVTLGTVSHQLLSYLWDHETEKLNYALDIQKKFSDMMINGATIDSLIRHLGTILKRPVLLIDPFIKIVVQSKQLQKEALLTKKMIQKMQPLLIEARDSGKEHSFMLDDDAKQKLLVSVYPIMTNSYFPYLLVIFKVDHIPYPFSQFAIEQANTVLSYTLYKNVKIVENRLSLQEDFFHQLTEKKPTKDILHLNLLDYGKDYGLLDTDYYRVVLVNFEESSQDKMNSQLTNDRHQLTFEWLNQQLPIHFKKALLFPVKNSQHYAIFLQKSTILFNDTLNHLREELRKILPISLHFSIGNEVDNPNDIHFSYHEALDTLHAGLAEETQPIVNFYQSKGIHKLIEYVPKEEIESFCAENLKSLAYPKNEMARELRRTLNVYLESQNEITTTSKKLFIHRNTVKYRIAKCEKLFETPITDPVFSLNLRLALILSDMERI